VVIVIETRTVPYRDGETSLTGFLAADSGGGVRPGILIVHGGAGLDEHARRRARQFADLGFTACACDMYGEGVMGNRERVMGSITRFRDDPSSLCRRAMAGIEILRSHPLVDGRTAAVGYCFGGMTVLELARSGIDLFGVVSVQGGLETKRPAEAGSIKCKILALHGALDPHVTLTHVNSLQEEMIRSGADWQLFIYGSAMHGFTHETAAGQQPASPIMH
jgi:dienelactone hydrolase